MARQITHGSLQGAQTGRRTATSGVVASSNTSFKVVPQAADGLITPNLRVVPGSGGPRLFGANSVVIHGRRGSFRASPSANPAGRRKRVVLLSHLTRALALASLMLLAVAVPGALASTGGVAAEIAPTAAPGAVATVDQFGRAHAPAGAPRAVRAAIAAGNRIQGRPYVWGGGHAKWKSRGYDCSGSVSYVLHAGGLLDSPLVSGAFARMWGLRGKGHWITVYANRGHAFAYIAGLRFDTSGSGGSGPRWRPEPR